MVGPVMKEVTKEDGYTYVTYDDDKLHATKG